MTGSILAYSTHSWREHGHSGSCSGHKLPKKYVSFQACLAVFASFVIWPHLFYRIESGQDMDIIPS